MSLSNYKFQFDEQDIRFIGYVLQILEGYYKEDAPSVLSKSRFLHILSDDSMYVYHYDEQYWAEHIYKEYEERKANERREKNGSILSYEDEIEKKVMIKIAKKLIILGEPLYKIKEATNLTDEILNELLKELK